MLTAIERTKGHYEVQEVDFGKVYRWCPERVDVGCECGERPDVALVSATTCPRCGANRTSTTRAVPAADTRAVPAADLSEDRALHPWRYDTGDLEEVGLPC